ncbi:MAG: hypothetical protein JRN51_08200 [Nitrososphaerota archaeon]|nr:hypothetical protein [Nitrososphaerota archaeon]
MKSRQVRTLVPGFGFKPLIDGRSGPLLLSLKSRRGDYSWPATKIDQIRLSSDQKSYSIGDTVRVNASFRVVGGLREAFQPDVWTVAWEDFDKILRLTFNVSIKSQGAISTKKITETKKKVRRASFYWSRDPDLPYRIWAMIVPEDGGPPKIPLNVEDAKSKMLDVEKDFSFPASVLGSGTHKIIVDLKVKWGRRSFIEKGELHEKSRPMVVKVE